MYGGFQIFGFFFLNLKKIKKKKKKKKKRCIKAALGNVQNEGLSTGDKSVQ